MKSLVSIIAALGLAAVCAYGVGCSNDGKVYDFEVRGACNDYCAQAAQCDDEVDVSACESDCESALNDCMADEQEQAVNEIDACSEESCDDFPGCTFGAGLQCSFGI